MKRILFILLTLVTTLGVCGQTKLTAEQQKQIVDKIDKGAALMKNMQCEFTQTKSMKMLKKDMQSKGVMYFKSPDKLRWQYTSPYDYIFILNGDKVSLKSAKSSKNIDVQRNKMFRQITDIILKSITGGGLKSAADFTVDMYKGDNGYYANLYPKKKELKQIYKTIVIYFNPELTMVSSVRMEEKTGDVTTVKLLNVKTNTSFNEKVFDIN
jgi:outer membrane lipoprotein carrier protein